MQKCVDAKKTPYVRQIHVYDTLWLFRYHVENPMMKRISMKRKVMSMVSSKIC